MPIYEYRCANCGGLVEVLVRSHASVPDCPNCGSPLAQGRQFSTPNVLSGEAHYFREWQELEVRLLAMVAGQARTSEAELLQMSMG